MEAVAGTLQTTKRGKLGILPNDTLELQFRRFATLRHLHPEKCKVIYDTGETLVTHASKGQLQKLRALLESTDDDVEILLYHSHRMFIQALTQGHLVVAKYIIDAGFPFRSFGLPCPLHESLASVNDYRAEEITRFLVNSGLDINFQESKNWLSPLHVAIKYQLFRTIQYMISIGADVNAIARDDIMPLNLAESADATLSVHKGEIIDLLQGKGARATWRRMAATTTKDDPSPSLFKSFSGGGHACTTESTSCTFKSMHSGSSGTSSLATSSTISTSKSSTISSSTFQQPAETGGVEEVATMLAETKMDDVKQFTKRCLTFSEDLDLEDHASGVRRPGQIFSTSDD